MILTRDLQKSFGRKGKKPSFNVGDTVDVHVRLKEGDKERIQVFTGICISRKHGGLGETFSVRRIVQGEGVERVFPLHSPLIEKVAVRKRGDVRQAKLYYLRKRVGKGTRVKERAFEADKARADGAGQEPKAALESAAPREDRPVEEKEVQNSKS